MAPARVAITAASAAGAGILVVRRSTSLRDGERYVDGHPHVAARRWSPGPARLDGQQIKQALATTAKTMPDADVFEQATAEVDAVRAVNQGVFATPTLSFGEYEETDTEAADKDITYTNTTDEAVDGEGVDHSRRHTERGHGDRPAKGTATVAVTVDPAKEATAGTRAASPRAPTASSSPRPSASRSCRRPTT